MHWDSNGIHIAFPLWPARRFDFASSAGAARFFGTAPRLSRLGVGFCRLNRLPSRDRNGAVFGLRTANFG
jgi:hypothetical protein